MPRFAIVKIFHILNIKKSIFLNIDFFMSLLFVAIYEYIGEGDGAWQLAICQADVMKKSNHFIVMFNYYGFIIVRKCVQNLSLKLKNSKVSKL